MFGIEGLLATTTSSERTNSRTIGWRAPWAWAQRKSYRGSFAALA